MRTETKIETHLGTVTVVRCPDYVWAGFDDLDACRLEVQAYPCDGKTGPVYFRGNRHLLTKQEDESWDAFWEAIDPDWDALPWLRLLAIAAFPCPMCDYCLGLIPPGAVQWGCTCDPERAEEVNALMRMHD